MLADSTPPNARTAARASEFDDEITVVRSAETMRAIMSGLAAAMCQARDAGIGDATAYASLIAGER